MKRVMEILVACFVSILGAGLASAGPQEVVSPAAGLTCEEALAALTSKIEMYQQLGEAYLQTHQALSNNYATWGRRLAQPLKPQELASMSDFFLRSAQSNQVAQVQSVSSVEALRIETDQLVVRLQECLKKWRSEPPAADFSRANQNENSKK